MTWSSFISFKCIDNWNWILFALLHSFECWINVINNKPIARCLIFLVRFFTHKKSYPIQISNSLSTSPTIYFAFCSDAPNTISSIACLTINCCDWFTYRVSDSSYRPTQISWFRYWGSCSRQSATQSAWLVVFNIKLYFGFTPLCFTKVS